VARADFAFLAVSTLAAIVSVLVVPRSLRELRSMGSDGWSRLWKRLDREHRKAISRALRRGRAPEDPADDELGLGLVDRVRRVRSLMRPIEVGYGLVVLALAAIGVWSGDYFFLRWGFAFLAILAALYLLAWWHRRQLNRGRVADPQAARCLALQPRFTPRGIVFQFWPPSAARDVALSTRC
jgi:hypothetical protein